MELNVKQWNLRAFNWIEGVLIVIISEVNIILW